MYTLNPTLKRKCNTVTESWVNKKHQVHRKIKIKHTERRCLTIKEKKKILESWRRNKMWLYTHTLTHWHAHVHFFWKLKEKQKFKKGTERQRKVYQERKREGEGRKKGRGERKRRLPWWPIGKESACSTGDSSSIPGLGGSHMPCSN